ncbi:MAG: suppressor of fused domain protein [Planctomycetota bacterium]
MEPDEPARRDEDLPPDASDPGKPRRGLTPPSGASHLDDITAHVERCFGPVRRVLHEVVSDHVHVDVLIAEVAEDHPYVTLVTSGMSDLPMPSQDGGPTRCEVMIRLMADHPLSQEAFADEANYWPIRRLKMIARMPHLLGSSFAAGHTIATNPPEPLHPGSEFCALGLVEPLDPGARTIRTKDGLEITLLQVVPMYREELAWKLQQPAIGALAELYDAESFRIADAGRAKLRGEGWDHLVRDMSTTMARGRRALLLVGSALGVVACADLVVTFVAAERPAWTRFGLGVWLASSVAQSSRLARWLAIALCVAAVAMGAVVLWQRGLADPRRLTLLATLPVYGACAAVLAFHPGVRLWLRHKPKAGDQ